MWAAEEGTLIFCPLFLLSLSLLHTLRYFIIKEQNTRTLIYTLSFTQPRHTPSFTYPHVHTFIHISPACRLLPFLVYKAWLTLINTLSFTHPHLHTLIYTPSFTHLHSHTFIYTPSFTLSPACPLLPSLVYKAWLTLINTLSFTHPHLHTLIYTPSFTHLHSHTFIYTPSFTLSPACPLLPSLVYKAWLTLINTLSFTHPHLHTFICTLSCMSKKSIPLPCVQGLADLVSALLELSPARKLLNMADEQRTTALHSASLLNRVEVTLSHTLSIHLANTPSQYTFSHTLSIHLLDTPCQYILSHPLCRITWRWFTRFSPYHLSHTVFHIFHTLSITSNTPSQYTISHNLSHTVSITYHTHTHPHSHTPFLTHTHTHTHSHTYTHTHTHPSKHTPNTHTHLHTHPDRWCVHYCGCLEKGTSLLPRSATNFAQVQPA